MFTPRQWLALVGVTALCVYVLVQIGPVTV